MKRTKWAGIALAGALLAGGAVTAAPAMASPCTSGPCTVDGTVTIGSTLTLTLDNTSFAITASPGFGVSTGGTGTAAIPGAASLYTVPSSYAVTATVSGNASAYTVNEMLAGSLDGNADFYNAVASSALGVSGTTYGWQYPMNDPTVGANGAFTTTPDGTGSLGQVVNQNTGPAASGDHWGLAWGWNVPGNQPSGAYVGHLTIIGLV